MKISGKIVFLLGFTSSFATLFHLYSADGRYAGQMEAETDGEIVGKVRKNVALYKKGVKVKTVALKRNAVMEDSVALNFDSLPEWIELEKNTVATLCRDGDDSGNWAVSNATGKVLDGGCFLLETPNVTGTVQVSFVDSSFRQEKTVRVAVGMKVLDLNGKKGKVGFHGEDYSYKSNRTVGPLDQESNRVYLYPERVVDLEGIWLVDKYPVTNCDFVLTMEDSLSTKCYSKKNPSVNEFFRTWMNRKREVEKSGNCNIHDSAAIKIYLYNALVYANRRSEREGLTPVYSFELLNEGNSFFPMLYADGSFEIYTASFFKNYDNRNLLDGWVRVTVDSAANGYRLPSPDEWMVFARGGDMDGVAYWKDDSSAKDYAWFGSGSPYRQDSRPVGMLLPNGYGLHDVLGLVCENTLIPPGWSSYEDEVSVCMGGFLSDSLRQLNYGRKTFPDGTGWGGYQGLRLIRQIR